MISPSDESKPMNEVRRIQTFEDPYIEGDITSNPLLFHGAPILRGTRITVVAVVTAIKHNPSRNEVAKGFGITRAQVVACITYCREHWPKFFLLMVSGAERIKDATGS